MEWGAVIAGLVTIAGLLVKAWLTSAPERQKEAENEAIQKGRADLVDGNVDAIESRIDRLCNGSSGSVAGLESAEDIEGRISRL